MAITYLKKSPKTSSTDDNKTTGIVQDLLKDIETTKEQGCIDLTKKFDKYDGEIIVSKDKIEKIKKTLDQKTKDDIQFSFERVRKFAEAQLKNYGQDFEVELSDGLYAGQKLVPVNTAGCYIPGGRYAHIASAVMSVTTAKVAGVKNIIACSPPKEGVGAHPTIVYTADLCGADVILNLGGVPAIAAMTNGLFKNPPADIIVGPGNQFVAEAKRILYGKVGIDLFAGPTEIGIIADAKADPEIVAVLIEYLTTAFTLEPGDLIPTGTPEGSAVTTQNWLKPGDKVKVEIEGLGYIENNIIQEPNNTQKS